ncbi:ABC transporter, ATP-binding protein [Actinomycetales bacterium JB111]|nr:ABC transporter, ATP-binding protein [Actinomycetales bacterium JB111]
MDPAIQVTGLTKSFGTHTVLDGLDLTVERGEIFALLGPNGAGKTTAITVLTTLVRPDAGQVVVAGHDVRRDPDAVKARIALTGQSAAVDEALNARENIAMFGRLSGLGARRSRERADELLARFGLSDAARRRVATFSGGMRRRLDLALSFVVQPQILFLDEPTTGLDTRSRRDVWDTITSLASAGTTVFLTTQYLEEADQLADRIAVLDGGRIVALGTADELKARSGGETVELRAQAGDLIDAVPTDGTVAGLRLALDRFDARGLEGVVSLRRPTLDDVFLDLTERTSPVGRDARRDVLVPDAEVAR